MPSVRRKLVAIVVKLGPLSEQNGFLRFLKNDDHAGILNGFVQDLAYAVTDYQVRVASTSSHERSNVFNRRHYNKAFTRILKGSRAVRRKSETIPKGSMRQRRKLMIKHKTWS